MSPIHSMTGRDARAALVAGLMLFTAAACSCSGSDEPEQPPSAGAAGADGSGNASAGNGPGVSAPGAEGDPNAVAQPGSSAGELPAGQKTPAPLAPPGKTAAPAQPAAPTAPAVRFVGRFDTSDPAGPRFAWSGSGIIARFSGTSVGVRLGGNQEYTVVIDGAVRPKLISSGNLDSLAADLPAGEHSVELYRRTEADQGEAQFLGFDFGGGSLLAPPPAPERRIEVIGDSISAGYGNEGADMNCPFSPGTENHYMTYGAIAARNVGADLVTVAWSGRGVVCNYGDTKTSCDNPMPTFVDRTLPARADSTWDFALYQPQAVVREQGIQSDPGGRRFAKAT